MNEMIIYLNQSGGRIVGLAFNYNPGYVFWSDISLGNRGIYRATTDSAGKLVSVNKIVSEGLCAHLSHSD